MKPYLETLWEYELTAHPFEENPEKIQLMDQLVHTEEMLFSILSKEQKELFQRYDNLLHEIFKISETEAFVSGVRCATSFWKEATPLNKF